MPPRHFVGHRAAHAGRAPVRPVLVRPAPAHLDAEVRDEWVVGIRSLPPSTTNVDLFDLIEERVTTATEHITGINFPWPGFAFVAVDSRRTGDLLCDTLEGVYIGRGHRLGAQFYDKAALLKANKPEADETPFGATYDDASQQYFCYVEHPVDVVQLRLVNRLVENVVKHGPAFEALVRHDKAQDEQFEFLYNHTHPLHGYYRCQLLATAIGTTPLDSPWPQRLHQGARYAVPISVFKSKALYSDISFIPPVSPETREQEIQRLEDGAEADTSRPYLGAVACEHLCVLLQFVSYSRSSVARAMAFAIDHKRSAREVVSVICASIVHPAADSRARIARLYVIGDILANVDVAHAYHTLFSERLPGVFETLAQYAESLEAQGRLTAERFRRQVATLLDAWADVRLFTSSSTDPIQLFRRAFKQAGPEDIAEAAEEVAGVSEYDKDMSHEPSAAPHSTPPPGPLDGETLDASDKAYYERLLAA